MDNVLQIHNIYTNAPKGELAKSKDLETAFGTLDTSKILLMILEKGEVQLGEKERKQVMTR